MQVLGEGGVNYYKQKNKNMNKKKSPLKDKPLRLAGQSVQEQLDKLIDDKFMNYVLVAAAMFGLTLYEWSRWYLKTPYNPTLLSVFTVPIIFYCVYKIISMRDEIRNLKLGRDGERAVGQELEKLRTQGCMVFHDIVADNFNIDHVVVSDKGIFLVETKTWSKPTNRVNPQVHYKNEKLLIDGLGDMSKILIQVKAASKWLRRTLQESTGKTFLIKPVILFPGWYVNAPTDTEIWVLEPKQLPQLVWDKKQLLSKEDKKLAAFHLSRYIRAL